MCNKCETREIDTTIELADNAMLKVRPELFYEWDFEENDKLGLDIYKVTKGTLKIIPYWNCDKCESSYDMPIPQKVRGNKCPYCSGHRVNHTNSLASLNPELALEWHPTLNGDLTPHNVTVNSNKEVWWKCDKGHKWNATVDTRIRSGCPYCGNRLLLVGFNDMWTTNPELASLLADHEDGYKYMQSSNKKVDWKCPTCNKIIKNKRIADVNKNRLYCPNCCKGGKSYSEMFIYYLLIELGIKFTDEKTFKWSGRRRYDFYLHDYNTIIEVNGEQHYTQKFNTKNGTIISDQIRIDKKKREVALSNGIDNYIVIEARKNELDYIKTNVINELSFINSGISDIDFNKIHKKSINSRYQTVCKLFNEGKTRDDIVDIMQLPHDVIRRYLVRSSKEGLTNYKLGTTKRTEFVQLSINNEYIKTWNGFEDVEKELNICLSNIIKCCKGKCISAGGYKWMYKKDYNEESINKYRNNRDEFINVHLIPYLNSIVNSKLYAEEWKDLCKLIINESTFSRYVSPNTTTIHPSRLNDIFKLCNIPYVIDKPRIETKGSMRNKKYKVITKME